MEPFEEKFTKLPPDAQRQVIDLIELLESSKRKKKKLSFNWIGGLKELRDQYTSVELQHKINEWRI